MEFTSSDKERLQHQFDCFCKKVLRYAARDIYKQQARLADHELSLSDFPEGGTSLAPFEDAYDFGNQQFHVLGFDIAIKNELLAEALRLLPDQRRNIILLSYFIGLNDREIGEIFNIMHRNVNYNRTSSLKKLRKIMEGFINEETKI